MKARDAAVRVSVPGKVMLAGEYSVLDGGPSLALTIDRHLTVRVKAMLAGDGIQVGSSLWDEPRKAHVQDQLTGDPLIDAVIHGAKLFGMHDVAVRIDSELEVRHGTGSSSALRLGVLLGLEELARQRDHAPAARPKSELWPTARAAYLLQKEAQIVASGYDVATQLLGGLVRFRSGADDRTWPAEATVIDAKVALGTQDLVHIHVGGNGAPTKMIMGDTRRWLESTGRSQGLAKANEQLVERFETAFAKPADAVRVRALVEATATQRRVMETAPTFPKDVATALATVPGLDVEWSFKTTGAGGEDALLLVGSLDAVAAPAKALRRLQWVRLQAGFETLGTRIERGATLA